MPASNALFATELNAEELTTAGVIWTPSMRSVIGMHITIDIIVMTENKLMLSIFTLPITFFEKTFRDVKVMFEPRAARRPIQLNDGSVKEARAIPATTGTNDATRAIEGISPRNSAENTTEKNGSHDLIVCVKETAT